MARSYRKNIKNLYGKPDVTARDVIALGASSVGGAGSLSDAQSISAHEVARAARLEGATAIVSSGLTAGTLSVALTVDGATVASGDITSAANYLDLVLEKGSDSAVDLAAGETVRLIYNAVGLGGTPNLSGRVYLSLLE